MNLSRIFKRPVFFLRCGNRQIYSSLGYTFIRRNLFSSPYHMIRKMKRDSQTQDVDNLKEDDDLHNLNKGNYVHNLEQEKVSPKRLLDDSLNFEGDKGTHPDDVWHTDPYEPVSKIKKQQEQGKYSASPPTVNPMDTSLILFPGQGTQFVGMGKDLLSYPNVKEMYQAASEILEYDILKLCLEGPASDLGQTKHQQPAVLLASLAAIEKLRQDVPSALETCVGTAGFSVGEITALTFAGAISFENAIRLVKVRGEAMQIASEMTRSGMMTVFYGADSRLKFACSVAKEFCAKNGIEDPDCRVANYLYPHCKVVAGNEEALQFIIDHQLNFKLKKIRRLNVSGAFHTDLMKPAALVFMEALSNTPISKPHIPVYSNVDGRPYKNVNHIQRQLPKQIYSPVRWEQTLHTMYERPSETAFPRTFECGPGSSLKTILKMVNTQAWNHCNSC